MPGLEKYSEEDLREVEQYLTDPRGEKILQAWVKDFVNTQLLATDAGQLIGSGAFEFMRAEDNSVDDTTSGTWVDLGGPTLSGLRAGRWLVWWGARISNPGGADVVSQIMCRIVGASGSDSQVASGRLVPGATGMASYGRHFDGVDAPALTAETNALTLNYMRQAGAGTSRFSQRWILAVRTGNV